MVLSRLKVDEMRKMLADIGFDKDNVYKLKRPQLLQLLKNNKSNKRNNNDEIEIVENDNCNNPTTIDKNGSVKCNCNLSINNDSVMPTKVAEPEKIAIDDKSTLILDRTQRILNMFHDDELDNGNPKVEGLRRVAEEVVGDIREEGCDLIQAPSPENGMMACAKAWIVFRQESLANQVSTDGRGGVDSIISKPILRRYEALADAHPGNVTDDFSGYLVAVADTRAKGRCFRNALKLKRVVAAEEIGRPKSSDLDNTNIKIDGQQIILIERLADRKNISITKLLTDMEIAFDGASNNSSIANLKSLSYQDALRLMARLNEYNQDNPAPNKLLRN